MSPASFGNTLGGYDGAAQVHANAGYFGIAATQGIQEVVIQSQSNQQNGSNSSSGFTLGDTGRMGASFIPIVGSGLDIYEGARDGNWVGLCQNCRGFKQLFKANTIE